MRRSTSSEMLTLDDARNRLGTAAIALADALADRPDRLASLLVGTATLRGLGGTARDAAHRWRDALDLVKANGLEWIVGDEVDGALSYAGWDDSVWNSQSAA
jgi:hypothetical protein